MAMMMMVDTATDTDNDPVRESSGSSSEACSC